MLPLVTSGMDLAVFTFLRNWNNFLVPLLYLPGRNCRPITTGLYLFLGGRSIDMGPLAAGTLIHCRDGDRALHRSASKGERGLPVRRREGLIFPLRGTPGADGSARRGSRPPCAAALRSIGQ
jgi:hypothetical protein